MKTVKSWDNILMGSSAQTQIPDLKSMFSVAHFGSFNESNQKKTNLRDTLSDKDGIKSFRKFLRSEFSEENLDFWIRCVAYKRKKFPGLRWQECRQIYNEFLAPTTPKKAG
ncbi:regulator of G-protein signaling 5-like [Styela clava]